MADLGDNGLVDKDNRGLVAGYKILANVWNRGRNSLLVVCWARCPA